MNSKTKWYCWSAVAGLVTYVLLALEMNRELHWLANKDYKNYLLTVFFFPLGVAFLVFTAINLRFMKSPVKKHSKRMIFGFVAYVLSIGLVNHLPMQPAPYKYLLALLPVLPLIYVCFAIISFVSDADEMKRKIVTEAMAFAGLATGFTCFSYVFIRQSGGLEIPLDYAFYIMWAYYFIGLFFPWRRYK